MHQRHHTRIKAVTLLGMSILLVGGVSGLAENQEQKQGGGRGRHHEKREGGGEKGSMHEERMAFHKAQREKIGTFYKSQEEASKLVREAVRAEEDAYKAVAMLKENRTKSHNERVAFFDGIEAENEAFMEASSAKQEEIRRERVRAQHEKRTTDRKAEQQKRYEESIALLDGLSAKEDLKKEDIGSALQGQHRGRRAHGERSRDKKCGKNDGKERCGSKNDSEERCGSKKD